MRRTPEERFWAKVDRRGPDECWLWTAGVNGPYGRFLWSRGSAFYAHRVAYTLLVGQVPIDLDLDHLCREPLCCNPAHMEPVTHAENIRRGAGIGAVLWNGKHPNALKTHCKRGHSLTDPENVRSYVSGIRQCRACINMRARRQRARARARRAL